MTAILTYSNRKCGTTNTPFYPMRIHPGTFRAVRVITENILLLVSVVNDMQILITTCRKMSYDLNMKNQVYNQLH